MTRFPGFSSFFAKQIDKTHKITSIQHGMSKILRQKFWSQGTTLGYPGPLFWQDLPPQFCRLLILVM